MLSEVCYDRTQDIKIEFFKSLSTLCFESREKRAYKGRSWRNHLRVLIKGTVCGVQVEEIEDPMMQNIRHLDKLIDELAKGKAMEKILRKQ